MPTYDYICRECARRFEEVKGIKAYEKDQTAICPGCGARNGADERDFSRASFNFVGTAVESAEYNPGLGAVVKSKYHKTEIMKKKGLIEVGNDFGSGEKQQTHFERRKKEELEKAWETGLGEADVG